MGGVQGVLIPSGVGRGQCPVQRKSVVKEVGWPKLDESSSLLVISG